ncbi:MAG: hypothetical protein UIG52_01145 [Bacteroidales bacterium]|nr:hypothetical protein [Bacteroidales bacterium]
MILTVPVSDTIGKGKGNIPQKRLHESQVSTRIFLFFTLAVGSWLLANFKLRQPKAKG